jgi:arylsulfatase A-like enzyme
MAFVCLAFVCSPTDAKAAVRPNIVLILADDLGYGDVGCYGQKRIQTPCIDRLAAEGIRFTQAYAGCTVCAPSRCVLMTGLHTGHCRVRGNGGATPVSQALRPEDATVARLLQKAGYKTALVGKWGLGDVGAAEVGLPNRQGFDTFYGYLNQTHAHNYYPTFLWRNEEKVLLRNVVPDERPNGAGVATTRLDYSPDLMLDEALAFIRRSKDGPFFMYFSPTLPHANNEAKNRGMEVPDYGAYGAMDWPEPQKGQAAMVTRLDGYVGRIVDLLKELGLGDKTLVIFTSDNGPHKEGGNDPNFNDSTGPLRGIKRDLYEGGIRVPLVARWPKTIRAGQTSDQAIWFADFLPTATAIAGVKPPKDLDGISVLPTLKGRAQTQLRQRTLYWEFHEGGFKNAVRQADWKLINQGIGRPLELYNLKKDVGETTNLAQEKMDVVMRLARFLAESRTESPDWPTGGESR